jgi:hypothetical protein
MRLAILSSHQIIVLGQVSIVTSMTLHRNYNLIGTYIRLQEVEAGSSIYLRNMSVVGINEIKARSNKVIVDCFLQDISYYDFILIRLSIAGNEPFVDILNSHRSFLDSGRAILFGSDLAEDNNIYQLEAIDINPSPPHFITEDEGSSKTLGQICSYILNADHNVIKDELLNFIENIPGVRRAQKASP